MDFPRKGYTQKLLKEIIFLIKTTDNKTQINTYSCNYELNTERIIVYAGLHRSHAVGKAIEIYAYLRLSVLLFYRVQAL